MEHPLITDQIEHFICQHLYDDPYKLMLSAGKRSDMEIKMVAEQIIARRKIKEKLPVWFHTKGLYYPSRLSTEQCSSEITALHKQQLIRGHSVCDLTGGLGVDCYYFSLVADHVIYVEREASYCKAAVNNFARLDRHNIEVINHDSRSITNRVGASTFYIDPARRGDSDKRLFALEECEPNILEMKDLLLEKADRVIIKISPMADIYHTLQLLPETIELHVVSVKNECKEILLVLEKGCRPLDSVWIKCFNYHTTDRCERFDFMLSDEISATANYTDQVAGYLYEPNASIQKAGGFKVVSERFNLGKLSPNSHLFVSDLLKEQFPGRIFIIKEVFLFNSITIKTLKKQYKKANISTRNFPLSPEELRKRLQISDGGNDFIFGTTIKSNEYILITGCKYIID